MAKTPPPRPPAYKGLSDAAVERITSCYVRVYAACASYGMSTKECRRYADDAVAGLIETVQTEREKAS